MAIGPEQRKALYRAKLTSLARLHFSDLDPEADATSITGFGAGAALRNGDRGVLLIDGDDAATSLGHGLASFGDDPPSSIDLLIDAPDDAARVVVRRAGAFAAISSVATIDGEDLTPARATDATVPSADVPFDDPHVQMMLEHGLEVLVESGAVIGELFGVEVARIAFGPDGEPRLDVGVGVYDQDAFAMMNHGVDPRDALTRVSDEVRLHRHPDAEPHPLNRLARERWIRSLICASPGAAGFDRLTAVPSIIPRVGIKETRPAVAIGTDADAVLTGLLCSVGVDLDLVPTAADVIHHYAVERIVLAMPSRDRYAVTDRLAAMLQVPVTFAVAEEPWPT